MTGNDEATSPESATAQPVLFDPGAQKIPEKLTTGAVLPTYADIVLTDEDKVAAAERWPDKSEKKQHQLMRYSILATLRHQFEAQDGSGRRMFGGPQPGAGRKKAALGNSLVEAAENRQQEILDAVFAPLSPGNDAETRHKAGIRIIQEVRKDREVDMKADELERASREELVKDASAILAQMVRDGDININDAGEIIDGEVVET